MGKASVRARVEHPSRWLSAVSSVRRLGAGGCTRTGSAWRRSLASRT